MTDLNIRNVPKELVTALRIEAIRTGKHMRELVIETLSKAYPPETSPHRLLESLHKGLSAAVERNAKKAPARITAAERVVEYEE